MSLGVLARSGAQHIIFMTDAAVVAATAKTVAALPRGSIVIFRGYNHAARARTARLLCRTVQSTGHLFLVAKDAGLARHIGADGVHMPEFMLSARRINPFGFRLITAACHSRGALHRAAMAGVDVALVSPVFATNSHPEARPLGVHRFARLTRGAPLHIAALGGVNPGRAGQLRGLDVHAVAGMSSLVV